MSVGIALPEVDTVREQLAIGAAQGAGDRCNPLRLIRAHQRFAFVALPPPVPPPCAPSTRTAIRGPAGFLALSIVAVEMRNTHAEAEQKASAKSVRERRIAVTGRLGAQRMCYAYIRICTSFVFF